MFGSLWKNLKKSGRTFSVYCCLAGKKFPDDFKFGVAGAAYQIEGGWNEDGRGPSMWDTFSHTPGKVKNNHTGDIACDSYHKYKEDVKLLKELGVSLYRFSLSWPRILPDGTPIKINQPGIDYYLSLIHELRSKNIEPLVTLYHWDLPQHLLELGGWLNPKISDYFGDYARIAYKHFGPYVKYWITINEPLSTCVNGYGKGFHAPGLKLPGEGIYQCAYVHLLAHAKAYRIYDQEFKATQKGRVAVNALSHWYYAKTNSAEDLAAKERAFDFNSGLYMNPVLKGNWPQVVIDRVGQRSKLEGYSFSRLPEFTEKELELITGSYDYFTLNIYTSYIIEHIPDPPIGTPSAVKDEATKKSRNPLWVKSASPWLFADPAGARHLLNYIREKYNPGEIFITENGWSDQGELDDQGRIAYYKGYLSNILDAILEDKINVTAYTLWSIMDNFEWNEGYTQRFGIVKVDFEDPNRPRTWKSSAKWYKKLVATRELETCHPQ